jgi:hypothetical protein
MHRKTVTLLIMVTILVSLACNFSAPVPTPEPTQVILTEPATVLPPTAVPATAEPTVTEATAIVPSTTGNGPLNEFSWFNINLPAGVANGGQSVVVAEMPPSDQSPAWDVAPQHEDISLTGYVLTGSFHEAQINVYPVQEFIALNPIVAERITTLQKIIQDKSNEPGNVPILPVWNATQVFFSNPTYLDFQNGSGIRYLTQYGQAIMPINNHDLFYSFQGLTTDGKYWISAILPVNHPSIQATYDDPLPADIDQFMANYEQYTTLLRANLDTQPPATFKPSLADLDAMISSIIVTH